MFCFVVCFSELVGGIGLALDIVELGELLRGTELLQPDKPQPGAEGLPIVVTAATFAWRLSLIMLSPAS